MLPNKQNSLIQQTRKNNFVLPEIHHKNTELAFGAEYTLEKIKSLIAPAKQNYLKQLTKREQECLHYVLRGFSAKQISRKLYRSNRTIEAHINNIKIKLKCKNKAALVELMG
jgi:DNA-binding NarL/FixJ family response regulator